MLRVAIVAAGWAAGWWLLGRPRPLPPAVLRSHRSVSVIIPARNEAERLPHLLATLGPLPVETLVVDDDSDDATITTAREAGATVVVAGPPPPGWAGKPWACQAGVDGSTGDDLVFVDADVWFAPGGLEAVVAELGQRGGLVSVQPRHDCGRGIESLSAMFNVVALMGIGAFAARGKPHPTGAFGPVMACSRADYDAIGGHRSVRSDVIEDVGLGRRFAASGRPVTCFTGAQAISFRMYPDGFGPLVEGWTKNIAAGAARATGTWTRALIGLWITAMASVCIARPGSSLFVAGYLAFGLQLRWLLRRAGRFRWWAWSLWPIGLAVFLAVFIRSAALLTARRPVRWKGRRVQRVR